jgi:hypothetical protein
MLAALSPQLHRLRFLPAAVLLAGVAPAGCARTSAVVPRTADPAPFFALRLAFNDSTFGRERVQYGGATFFLAPEVLLSDGDVLSVSSVMRPGGVLLLHVRYRPESGQRLATVTAYSTGASSSTNRRCWSCSYPRERPGRSLTK